MDRKKLPIGISSFREIIENNYFYIDKSLLIEELLYLGSKVTLITRPRRFGKTLNMTMLREFFSLDVDSKEIFSGLKIMKTKHANELNKYPVIFFSFKDVKGNKSDIVTGIKTELLREFERYNLIEKDLDVTKRIVFDKIKHTLLSDLYDDLNKINNCIRFLAEIIHAHYGVRPLLLIDEYDTPMISAYENNCYDELRNFFSNLFSTALKDNPHLNFAVLTGIQRVAKENIFSGLNNIKVCTVMDERHNDKFGLTTEETLEFLRYYDLALNDQVSAMYNGYNFAGEQIFNPWSIINYGSTKKLEPYWINTSSNILIRNLLAEADEDFYQEFEMLISTGAVEVEANLSTSFFEIQDTSTLWGLLINSGYLTLATAAVHDYELNSFRIPNREVKTEFQSIVANYTKLKEGSLKRLFSYLLSKRFAEFEKEYQKIVLARTSYHDQKENAYHMLFLGMGIYLDDRYVIRSNIEAGLGRADIIFTAKDKKFPHLIIEFKQGADVEKLAVEALAQIHEKKYYAELTGETLLVGVAHSGKEVKIFSEIITQ